MHKCTEYGTASPPRGKLASVHVIMKEHNHSQEHTSSFTQSLMVKHNYSRIFWGMHAIIHTALVVFKPNPNISHVHVPAGFLGVSLMVCITYITQCD